MSEYQGDVQPNLQSPANYSLDRSSEILDPEELRAAFQQLAIMAGCTLELDLTEVITRAGLLRQVRELFTEFEPSTLSLTQEKVLFIDYLHLASLLLEGGIDALIRKFERAFDANWTALSEDDQHQLLPHIIQWYLETIRLRSRSYLELESGKQGVTVGFEVEYYDPKVYSLLGAESNRGSDDEPYKYGTKSMTELALPASRQITSSAPLNTKPSLTDEYLRDINEIVTTPSSADSRVGLIEILTLAKLDRVEFKKRANAHITLGGVRFDQFHPQLVEIRALLSAFPPSLDEEKIAQLEQRHERGLSAYQETFPKPCFTAEGEPIYMPFFQRRHPNDEKVQSYRSIPEDVIELRSFRPFGEYEDWFTSFCKQTDYLLVMAKGAAASQADDAERDKYDAEMAKAFEELMTSWDELKQDSKIETPQYEKFFIPLSPSKLLNQLKQIIDTGKGEKLRAVLERLIEQETQSRIGRFYLERYNALMEYLFYHGSAPSQLDIPQIIKIQHAIGSANAPTLFFERVMYASITSKDFNTEMRRMLREYREKVRKIESLKFAEAREQQIQRVQAVSNTIRAILSGAKL